MLIQNRWLIDYSNSVRNLNLQHELRSLWDHTKRRGARFSCAKTRYNRDFSQIPKPINVTANTLMGFSFLHATIGKGFFYMSDTITCKY